MLRSLVGSEMCIRDRHYRAGSSRQVFTLNFTRLRRNRMGLMTLGSRADIQKNLPILGDSFFFVAASSFRLELHPTRHEEWTGEAVGSAWRLQCWLCHTWIVPFCKNVLTTYSIELLYLLYILLYFSSCYYSIDVRMRCYK